MKRCFFILILLACTSCHTNYRILNSGNGVRSNLSIKTTFSVCKIDSILSFDDNVGVPNDFVIGKSYIIEFKENTRNPKKVLFFKKSNKYYWESNNIEYEKIPNNFAEQGWYVIRGLKVGGFDRASFDLIFYYLDENGEVEQYYTSLFGVNFR